MTPLFDENITLRSLHRVSTHSAWHSVHGLLMGFKLCDHGSLTQAARELQKQRQMRSSQGSSAFKLDADL
jgi:hypothetical protein